MSIQSSETSPSWPNTYMRLFEYVFDIEPIERNKKGVIEFLHITYKKDHLFGEIKLL
jgi:hypothetical protein